MKFQILPFSKQRFHIRLLPSSILGVLLFLTPVANAEFVPRERKPASDYTRSGGSRGCPSDEIPLTLLAPKTYIGYTTSLRPTFVGFGSTARKIRFRIFEFDSNNTPQQIGNSVEQEINPGVFQILLPENQPELTVGKKYLWQVAIDCANSTDTKLVERAEFIVVEKPSVLKNKLTTTANDQQKANIYAKADLWYEALAEALKSVKTGKLGQVGLNLVKDLAKSEFANTEEDKKRIQQLQKIVIHEN